MLILVVDDDVMVRDGLVRLLRKMQLGEILIASDGVEALLVLDKQPIDLVISDIDMPNLGGLELSKRTNVPCVLITGYSDRSLPSGVVRKPFRLDEIVDAMCFALGVSDLHEHRPHHTGISQTVSKVGRGENSTPR